MFAMKFSLFLKKLMWHIKIKMMKSNTSKILSTYWTNFWFIQKVFIIHASKINSLANFVFSMSSMFGPNNFSKHQRLNCGNLVQKQLFCIRIIDSNDKQSTEKWKSSQKRSHLYFSIVYILLNINDDFLIMGNYIGNGQNAAMTINPELKLGCRPSFIVMLL